MKRNPYEHFTVRRRYSRFGFGGWTVTSPDNARGLHDAYYTFKTWREAFDYAHVEATKAKAISQLTEWLETPKGYTEFVRLMTWWGEFRFEEFLENV